MPLTHCVDCGQAHSDQAYCCPACGRPQQRTRHAATRWDRRLALFAVALTCVVVWYVAKAYEPAPPVINPAAPWGDRAAAMLKYQMRDGRMQERVANAIIHHLHSGGTATGLESYRVFTRGNGLELVMECTVNWTEGGCYQSTIRWITSERGDCKTELVSENTVLGVISMKNLTTWFHTQLWPQVNRDAGGR